MDRKRNDYYIGIAAAMAFHSIDIVFEMEIHQQLFWKMSYIVLSWRRNPR